MSIENRPYVGTWRLDSRELVQNTPDALVYINGDTSLPGCPKCNGRIDIQKFVTEVSVDAGTDPGAASASFTLSIPLHHTNSFARDAKFLLTPGLEVHIYMRGYFPVRGMFRNLAEAPFKGELTPAGESPVGNITASKGSQKTGFQSKPTVEVSPALTSSELEGLLRNYKIPRGGSKLNESQLASAKLIYQRFTEAGYTPAFALGAVVQASHESHLNASAQQRVRTSDGTIKPVGPGLGLFQLDRKVGLGVGVPYFRGGRTAGNATEAREQPDKFYDATDPNTNIDRMIAAAERYKAIRSVGKDPNKSPSEAYYRLFWSPLASGFQTDRTVEQFGESYKKRDRHGRQQFGKRIWGSKAFNETEGLVLQAERFADATEASTKEFKVPVEPSLLDQFGLGGKGIENLLNYPYYHVFHGVVTQVSHSWSGGVNSISVNAVSMLHFWQYHTISTNASVFGARPTNSKLKTSMVGHNFTGMHPYQIMYTLHHDMVGAAGGVGWALSSKTNQSAVSEVAGESLFSLNIRYWEKRFAQRMVKLRMHGASGELFSALQSTFLGRTGTDDLKKLVRHRFSDPSSRKGRAKEILGQSVSAGLYNRRRLEALLFARSTNGNSSSKGGTKFELNLAEMQAFVSNIGNWGQPAFFESVYESKLDIAQKVMEITGFEFYQDVDGDFVFKPPMYNLDTSSSRIYRIEDIDIISISTDEKEPQATYATVKGSQFKNVQGTGVENEWGVRGQYIDYRLVAQYGWRPAAYETAYLNDPKSMFFSAINRLDILNAPSKAASITIPVRPELRPGYPVYVPYLDAFYYCNSFSHSHSVGGQCTTSLQLVGKRAKFYAPGHPDKKGIDAIDLGQTLLPERPLQVTDRDGHPRLAGFPNVVMALDPYAINPMFWVVGSDIERLDDPIVLRNILQMGAQQGLIADKGNGSYTLTLPVKKGEDGEQKQAEIEFWLSDDLRLPEQVKASRKRRKARPRDIPKTTIDIIAAGEKYTARKAAANKVIEQKVQEVVKLQAELVATTSSLLRAPEESSRARRLRTKKARLKRQITEAEKRVEATKADTEASFNEDKNDGVFQLSQLIKSVGEQFFLKGGTDLRRIPETHNLLDMLSDKKAILSNGTQPGQYRYYSASHPDPRHQGQEIVEYSNPPDGKSPKLIRHNSFLDPEWQGTVVEGFVKTPIASIPGTEKPEAELGDVRPVRGMRVLTANPSKPNGEVVPTSQIREMMFAVQDMTQTRGATSTEADDKPVTLGEGPRWRFKQMFNIRWAKTKPSADTTIKKFFAPAWAAILTDVTSAVVLASKRARTIDDTKVMPYPDALPGIPSSLPLGKKGTVSTTTNISEFKLEGTKGAINLGGTWAKLGIGDFLDEMGKKLVPQMAVGIENMRAAWRTKLRDVGQYEEVQIEQIMAEMNAGLAARWKIDVKSSSTTRTEKKGAIKRRVHSPVFPVSDAKGYEVIGSYRYGRGVDIEPGGVWDSLHQQDPNQFLDRKTVEDIQDAVLGGRPITVEREHIVNGGKKVKVKVPLQGDKAVRDVEKRALTQYRKHLTDQQIIDLGLAVPNAKDPSLLELNFSNYYSDGNKEGIHKLPINNAAFTLADLTNQQDGRMCSCKAAEADLLLEAFGGSEFLQFAAPGVNLPKGYGTGAEDRATEFLTNQAMFKSVSWKQRQDALRGTAMERPSGSILSQFQDLGTAVVQGAAGQADRQQAALTNFNNAIEQANRAAQNVRDETDGGT